MVHTIEIEVAGRTLRLETGRVARQADGSIWATYGDTGCAGDSRRVTGR